MADDLENKPQKNKETKKDEKIAKTSSFQQKPVVVATSPSKTDELKKNTSNIDNKEEKVKKNLSQILKIKKLNQLKKMLNLIKSWMTLKMKRNQSYL